jgi:hypothetical protein
MGLTLAYLRQFNFRRNRETAIAIALALTVPHQD